jgi:hypothetical protein
MGFVQKVASGHAQPIRPAHAAYVTWVGQARPAPLETVPGVAADMENVSEQRGSACATQCGTLCLRALFVVAHPTAHTAHVLTVPVSAILGLLVQLVKSTRA